MSLKNAILRATRRTVKGLTVGEIFDRLCNDPKVCGKGHSYETVRARVYELASEWKLTQCGVRKDKVSGRDSKTFRRTH